MLDQTRRKYLIRATVASLTMCLPTLLVLGVLAVREPLALDDIFIGLLVAVPIIIFLVFRHYLKIADARDYIGNIAATRQISHKPPKRPASMKEMVAAIQDLNQSWAQANAQLRAFAEALESVIDSIPDPLLMIDESRRVVRANIATRTLFGANVQGRDLSSVIRDHMVLEAVNKALEGQSSRAIELTLPMPDQREFRLRIEPLFNSTADGTRAILALSDITTLRRAEKTMADFVANASHELKTPLSALVGFVETLQGAAKDDPKARERFLKIMHEQAGRMTNLVLDLLSLSSLEMEAHKLPSGRVNLEATLNRVLTSLEQKVANKQIKVSKKITGPLPTAIGDQGQLEQVLQNLIDNAIKYGKEGGKITIQAQPEEHAPPHFPSWDGPAIRISVTDDGDGVPAEALPRLTERFYRVEQGKTKASGTGLGLAIVKHIIKRHRGYLHIESTLGKGSTFTVYLRGLPPDNQNVGDTKTGDQVEDTSIALEEE